MTIPPKLSWKNFTELDSTESQLVLTWRNHMEVRKWMTTDTIIDEAQHQDFLASLQSSDNQLYYLLYFDGTPTGVVDFYNFSDTPKRSFFGYYLDPDQIGSSAGLLLELWVAEFGFQELHLEEIVAETKPENERAMELHQLFGFQNQGDQANSDGLQEAVLRAETWTKKKQELSPLIQRFFCQ